ncbi:heterokaryon incompatibility, partial [Setomelanomma holmii]
IACQDGIVMITQSLETVLRRVRSPSKTLRIWADGICIDQHDIREREAQVKLMLEVYSFAHKVIMWLRYDSDGDASKAFELIRHNYNFDYKRNAPLSYPGNDCSPLMPLSSLIYFKRIWTIQEGFLASMAV